jgi:protein PhnA
LKPDTFIFEPYLTSIKNIMEIRTVRDSNGTLLNDGDSVVLIKSLKVKGSSITLKQGTSVKKIKLTDNDEEVDCRVNNMSIVLKTCFLKKS